MDGDQDQAQPAVLTKRIRVRRQMGEAKEYVSTRIRDLGAALVSRTAETRFDSSNDAIRAAALNAIDNYEDSPDAQVPRASCGAQEPVPGEDPRGWPPSR